MKTNVRETSIEAFRTHIQGDECMTKRVIDFVRSRKQGTTGREIAEKLRMDTATVSGIVRPAVKGGELIRSEVKAPCPVTGNNALWIHHKDNMAGQRDMFGGSAK